MEHLQQNDYLRLNQVRILYDQSGTTFLFPVIAALALCRILWPVSNQIHLLLWTGIVIIYSLGRYLLIWKRGRRELTPENAAEWLDLYTLSVFVSGILWGMAAIVLIPYRHDELIRFTLYNSLTLVIICGLVAGAVITYSVCIRVLLFYSIPALVPPAFYLISLGDQYNSALGGFVLLYLLFVSLCSIRLNEQYFHYINMENKLRELQIEHKKLKNSFS